MGVKKYKFGLFTRPSILYSHKKAQNKQNKKDASQQY